MTQASSNDPEFNGISWLKRLAHRAPLIPSPTGSWSSTSDKGPRCCPGPKYLPCRPQIEGLPLTMVKRESASKMKAGKAKAGQKTPGQSVRKRTREEDMRFLEGSLRFLETGGSFADSDFHLFDGKPVPPFRVNENDVVIITLLLSYSPLQTLQFGGQHSNIGTGVCIRYKL